MMNIGMLKQMIRNLPDSDEIFVLGGERNFMRVVTHGNGRFLFLDGEYGLCLYCGEAESESSIRKIRGTPLPAASWETNLINSTYPPKKIR